MVVNAKGLWIIQSTYVVLCIIFFYNSYVKDLIIVKIKSIKVDELNLLIKLPFMVPKRK